MTICGACEMGAEWERIARSCAMRARRAAELVDGALTRLAQELLDVLFLEILALVAPLSQEDRNRILDEFDAGKIYILIELNIRSQLYESLPLKLLILGHLDVDKVRAGLIDCLLQYEALENPDVISQSILWHASMRAEALRFVVEHIHITECPGLRRFRLRALFLPTTEISIERKHAELHRWILSAPHHSPAFASLGVRRKEVTATVDDPLAFESLCEASINMHAPEDCLQVIGIVHHPDTQQYRREDGTFSSSAPDSIAKNSVYRCDFLTIHRGVEGVDNDADDPGPATLIGPPPLVAPPSPPPLAAPSNPPLPGPHGGGASGAGADASEEELDDEDMFGCCFEQHLGRPVRPADDDELAALFELDDEADTLPNDDEHGGDSVLRVALAESRATLPGSSGGAIASTIAKWLDNTKPPRTDWRQLGDTSSILAPSNVADKLIREIAVDGFLGFHLQPSTRL